MLVFSQNINANFMWKPQPQPQLQEIWQPQGHFQSCAYSITRMRLFFVARAIITSRIVIFKNTWNFKETIFFQNPNNTLSRVAGRLVSGVFGAVSFKI